MPYGTHKLLGAASTAAAWQDWRAIQSWCEQNGHSALAAQHAPKEGAGHKTVDKRIEKLRVALGAPAGPWKNILDGLTPVQQRLPPGVRPIVEEALVSGDLATANERLHQLSGGKTIGQVADEWAAQVQPPAEPEQREQHQPLPQLPSAEPRPSPPAEEQTYTQRVWTAYRALCDEMQTPDVPIHALHRRVGGSLPKLQNHLRAECLAHRATPSTGEPAFAGDAARQSALWLPGETDRATGKPQSFLLIKLIDPPTMTQGQQPPQAKQHPKITLTLNANQAELVAEALHYGAYELEQYADGHGRDIDGVETHCDYLSDLEKGLMAFVTNPKEHAGELARRDQATELPDQAVAKRYERLVRETAALRYPYKERTPELQERIEKTIARKVGEFTQERRAKAYEASLRKELAERHPNLTPEQAQRYERRINELVDNFRKNQAQQQQQQTQTPPARSQQQGRGMEIER